VKQCQIAGCELSPGDYPFCHAHWYQVPWPLRKTLMFLYNQGHIREGFEDAVANAAWQIRLAHRR
jgi:hypothetical protein